MLEVVDNPDLKFGGLWPCGFESHCPYQKLKRKIMNSYDKRLIERLRNWEKVYPEDDDKPEGNLYLEAAERIVELLKDQPEELDYTLDYDQDGLWLLQDGMQVSHVPQSLFDNRIRQIIRQSKSLDQLAKYDQEDGLFEKEESEMYQTETIAQNVDGLTLISLKYSLQICKANRDEMDKKRDMKGWNAGNQEDWNTVVQDIHALERVIEFYGG